MTESQRASVSRRELFRTMGLGGSVLLFGTLSGCSLFGETYGNGDSSEDGQSTEATTVEMRDVAFQPQTLNVTPGTTVTWINRDGVDHTVTREGDFDSGRIAPGERFELTFDENGTYDYVCTIHPGMTGRVVVEAST